MSRYFVGLLWGIAIGFMAWRVHFAINFTDESYYVALVYKFLQGLVPFRDELTVQQSAYLAFLPLIKILYWVQGQSREGIYLASRHLYLFFHFLSALAITLVLKGFFSPSSRWFVGVLFCTCIAFGVAHLSYDTIAMCGVAVSLFSAFAIVESPRPPRAFAHGAFWVPGLLAVLAYPSLVLVFFGLFLVMLSKLTRPNRIFFLKAMAVASLVVAANVVFALKDTGFEDLRQAYLFTVRLGKFGGWPKLQALGEFYWRQFPALWLLAPFGILIAAGLGARKEKWVLYGNLGLLSAVTLYYSWSRLYKNSTNYSHEPIYVQTLCGLAPFFVYTLAPARMRAGLMTLIVIPSCLASLLMGFTSATAGNALSYAALPGALLSVLLVFEGLLKEREWLRIGAMAMIFLLFVKFQHSFVYEEDGLRAQSERISDGPFAGIYTTPRKFALLQRIKASLASVDPVRSKVIFYYNFSPGYLMTDARPGFCCPWADQRVTNIELNRPYLKKCLERLVDRDTYVFRIEEGLNVSPDLLGLEIQACNPRMISSDPDFDLWVIKRCSSQTGPGHG